MLPPPNALFSDPQKRIPKGYPEREPNRDGHSNKVLGVRKLLQEWKRHLVSSSGEALGLGLAHFTQRIQAKESLAPDISDCQLPLNALLKKKKYISSFVCTHVCGELCMWRAEVSLGCWAVLQVAPIFFFKCQGFSLVWNSQSRLGRQVSELGSPSAASLLGTGVLNVHIHSGPFNHGFWEWSPDLMLIQQALSRQNVFPRQKIFSLWKNEQKYQETLARFHDPLQMSETTSVTETHRRTDLVCFPS